MVEPSGWEVTKIGEFWCATTPFVTIRCFSKEEAETSVRAFDIEFKKGQCSVVNAIAKAADAPEPYTLL